MELKIGIVLLILLISISLCGPLIAPFDSGFSESLRTVIIDGEKEYIFAPEHPNSRHLLGTAQYGYDTLTMLLYGARYTLGACFLIALFRLIPGILIGLYAGIKNKPSKKIESLGAIQSFLFL